METQVIIRGNQVIVPVNVRWRNSKRTLNLLLDTGASITVLHQSAVAPLNAVGRDTGYAQLPAGEPLKLNGLYLIRWLSGHMILIINRQRYRK